jgi:hypothetical protein
MNSIVGRMEAPVIPRTMKTEAGVFRGAMKFPRTFLSARVWMPLVRLKIMSRPELMFRHIHPLAFPDSRQRAK